MALATLFRYRCRLYGSNLIIYAFYGFCTMDLILVKIELCEIATYNSDRWFVTDESLIARIHKLIFLTRYRSKFNTHKKEKKTYLYSEAIPAETFFSIPFVIRHSHLHEIITFTCLLPAHKNAFYEAHYTPGSIESLLVHLHIHMYANVGIVKGTT